MDLLQRRYRFAWVYSAAREFPGSLALLSVLILAGWLPVECVDRYAQVHAQWVCGNAGFDGARSMGEGHWSCEIRIPVEIRDDYRGFEWYLVPTEHAADYELEARAVHAARLRASQRGIQGSGRPAMTVSHDLA